MYAYARLALVALCFVLGPSACTGPGLDPPETNSRGPANAGNTTPRVDAGKPVVAGNDNVDNSSGKGGEQSTGSGGTSGTTDPNAPEDGADASVPPTGQDEDAGVIR